MLDISELDQEPKTTKRCEVAVVDVTVASTHFCRVPFTVAWGPSYMSQGYLELVIRSDAGGKFTVEAVKHYFLGPRRSIDYCTANLTQSQGSVEGMGGCHRMRGKSCLVY